MSARHDGRKDRWRALSDESTALEVGGVIAKSAAAAGIVFAAVGLLGVPVLVYAGSAVTLLGLGFWWAAATVIARRTGVTTRRAMWNIWMVPTWTFVLGVLDFFV